MNKNNSFRKTMRAAAVVTAILALAGALLIVSCTAAPLYRWLLLALFAAALVFAWGLLQIFQRQVISYFDSLDQCLDQMIDCSPHVELPQPGDPESVTARMQTKLERMYTTLRENGRQHQRGMEDVQSLVADISHQVKTPTANIKMYLSILTDRDMPREKQLEFLASASAQTDKLDFLIQSLIKMSRLETGAIQLFPRRISVSSTLAAALGGILLNAEKKEIRVCVDCPEHISAMHDPKWTGEALFNILDNAVKYTQKGGSIAVSVSQWECYTKIDVSDSGKGVAESAQGMIFQRFYREQDVSDVSGAGLGLYLAREIVSRQNGYISLTSAPGKGSCFSVFLPNE